MLNGENEDGVVLLHPEQIDTTRVGRRRNCCVGLVICVVVAVAAAVIAVAVHHSHTHVTNTWNDAIFYSNGKLRCTRVTVQSTDSLSLCDGISLKSSELINSTRVATVEEPHLSVAIGLLTPTVTGEFDHLGAYGAVASVVRFSNSHLVAVELMFNTSVFSIQLKTKVSLFREYVQLCASSEAETSCPAQSLTMNFMNSSFRAEGWYTAGQGVRGSTLWAQSFSRRLLVASPVPNRLWVNASGAWVSDANASDCTFDRTVTYDGLTSALSQMLFLGNWTLRSALGSETFPAPLRSPRNVSAFVGFLREIPVVLLWSFKTDSSVENENAAIAAIYRVARGAGFAQYFDTVDYGEPTFSDIPVADFPLGCPNDARTSWASGLFAFKYSSQNWMSLLQ